MNTNTSITDPSRLTYLENRQKWLEFQGQLLDHSKSLRETYIDVVYREAYAASIRKDLMHKIINSISHSKEVICFEFTSKRLIDEAKEAYELYDKELGDEYNANLAEIRELNFVYS